MRVPLPLSSWLVAAALYLAAFVLPAGAETVTEGEIALLLTYIEGSECTFLRNGKEHGSAEAREHIGKKYDYVKKRVATAEDFIEYAATKSSLSGKAYLVRCDGVEMATAEWLKAELALIRQSAEAASPP